MTAALYFLAGFLTATAVATALAYAYFLRARRRVRAIQAHIANYQKASQTVGAAIDHFQPRNS